MSGYDWSEGKSNNAVEAESEGKYAASVVARKLGIPSAVIKKHCSQSEWHHTGKMFMETAYYDLEKVQEWLSTDDAKEAIAEYKSGLKEKAYKDCSINWTEWSGRKKGRKQRTDFSVHGTVITRGSWIWFRHNGKVLKKKSTGNWISIMFGEELDVEQARKDIGGQ